MVSDVFQKNPDYLTVLDFDRPTEEPGHFLSRLIRGVRGPERNPFGEPVDESCAGHHPRQLRACFVFLIHC